MERRNQKGKLEIQETNFDTGYTAQWRRAGDLRKKRPAVSYLDDT